MVTNFRSFLQCSVGYGVKFENSGCSRSLDVSVCHYFSGCLKFLKTDRVKIEQSFEYSTSILGGGRQMRWRTFYTKFNFEQLLFEPFFDEMRIFGIVELQIECVLPLLKNIILQPH